MDKLSAIFNDVLETICNGKRDEKLQEKIDTIEAAFKALEIIKDRFSIQFQKANCGEKECLGYYGIMQIGINPIYIRTQEEYDLLKEVLL